MTVDAMTYDELTEFICSVHERIANDKKLKVDLDRAWRAAYGRPLSDETPIVRRDVWVRLMAACPDPAGAMSERSLLGIDKRSDCEIVDCGLLMGGVLCAEQFVYCVRSMFLLGFHATTPAALIVPHMDTCVEQIGAEAFLALLNDFWAGSGQLHTDICPLPKGVKLASADCPAGWSPVWSNGREAVCCAETSIEGMTSSGPVTLKQVKFEVFQQGEGK